ncbi:SDR family NAD(P)-dependent oxidoreductase [Halodurantibacterium flavum]|uniref:SDR family NAD(P)-dependent oxidoreductase n=1 Tax=Halodurantibacterium flavum TaxID=1382802 RepID=A0ABW4S7X2_9RHOB
MREWQGKRYWLVGASEGLGRALAHVMSRAGTELIVSARSEERLADLVAELPGRASYVTVDVRNSASVTDAAAEIGPLDGVVYLAGSYAPVSASAWDAARVEEICDINFTGCARVMGAVVPAMVARGEGHLVMCGSAAGPSGLPNSIGYGAAKAGVAALARSMQQDLRSSGVEVQLFNAGLVRSAVPEGSGPMAPLLMDAEEAAQEMFEHMNTTYFSKSFPRGASWLLQGSRLLPDRAVWGFGRRG